MTDDLVARLRHEGDDEAVEALRLQEASIRRLERKLAAAEAKEHESFQQYVDANEARIDAEARVRELEARLAETQEQRRQWQEASVRDRAALAEAYERCAKVADKLRRFLKCARDEGTEALDRATAAESELSTLRARVREVVGPFAEVAGSEAFQFQTREWRDLVIAKPSGTRLAFIQTDSFRAAHQLMEEVK